MWAFTRAWAIECGLALKYLGQFTVNPCWPGISTAPFPGFFFTSDSPRGGFQAPPLLPRGRGRAGPSFFYFVNDLILIL